LQAKHERQVTRGLLILSDLHRPAEQRFGGRVSALKQIQVRKMNQTRNVPGVGGSRFFPNSDGSPVQRFSGNVIAHGYGDFSFVHQRRGKIWYFGISQDANRVLGVRLGLLEVALSEA
jgi:hypothetical protein